MTKEGRKQILIGACTFAVTTAIGLGFGTTRPSEAAPQAGAAAATARAQPQPAHAALPPVRPGMWAISGEGMAPRRLCVRDAGALVQMEHGGASCERLVVASGTRDATVQYSCPGAGWGRTALSVRGGDTAHIDTQGIAGNAPFAYQADARREGDCPARTL